MTRLLSAQEWFFLAEKKKKKKEKNYKTVIKHGNRLQNFKIYHALELIYFNYFGQSYE